jgi:hypothetical protein
MKYLKANLFLIKEGRGTLYFEVDDAQNIDHSRAEWMMHHNQAFTPSQVKIFGVIQRQINVFGERMYWATWDTEKDGDYPITDQPEIYPEELRDYLEIDASEFEDIWNQSLIESVA